MKTRILLLAAFVAVGAGCKGNGEATKATPPGQVGEVSTDQNGREYRQIPSGRFLDNSHVLRRLVPSPALRTDPRLVDARLVTDAGHSRSKYDLRLWVQGNNGFIFPFKLKGRLVLRGNMGAIDMIGIDQFGRVGTVGVLTSVIDLSNNRQCAHISGNFAGVGQTSLLICEKDRANGRAGDDYDDDYDDRDDRRRDRDRRRNR